MNIFLAAIIFSFFAVFAPNSHGDRPLLLAEAKIGQIQYSDFKLPIARLQAATNVESDFAPLFLSQYFLSTETVVNPDAVIYSKQNILLRNKLVSIHTTPFKFCEIFQV